MQNYRIVALMDGRKALYEVHYRDDGETVDFDTIDSWGERPIIYVTDDELQALPEPPENIGDRPATLQEVLAIANAEPVIEATPDVPPAPTED